MQILAEKKWSYVLMDDGIDWILTFLIGGVVETDLSIRLTAEEILKIKNNAAFLDILVETGRTDRAAFANREINPPVWPTKT
nr:hypothetical protein [uncultured Undibacterium sp.]